MTLIRTTTLIATSIAMFGFAGAASAQISTGTEYRQANDIVTDSFGEDYDSQKRAAEEDRANGRSISKTAARYIKSASEANAEGDYAKAVEHSRKALLSSDLTPYEQSLLYQINAEGSLKSKDFSGAKKSYEMAVASGGMNAEESTKIEAFLVKFEEAGVK